MAGAKEDDYLVDEELNAVIVAESQRGEREREEEELAEATARLNMASIRQGRQTSQAPVLKICTIHFTHPPPPQKKTFWSPLLD